MLYKITWQHYLLYVAIALLIWYGIILWLYYRDEVKRLIERSNGRVAPDEEFINEVGEEEEDLLGKPAEEYGVSTVGSEGISFGVKLPEDAHANPYSQEELLQGLIPDVLEEIKEVMHTIEIENGDKEDFKSLFKLVSSKYPQLVVSGYLDAINKIISETAPFNLSDEELKQLWE